MPFNYEALCIQAKYSVVVDNLIIGSPTLSHANASPNKNAGKACKTSLMHEHYAFRPNIV